MAKYSEEVVCCEDESNILEVEGTHVCTKCGLVKDMLCFYNAIPKAESRPSNMFLLELCNRAEIDESTHISRTLFPNMGKESFNLKQKNTICMCYLSCLQKA